MLTNKSLKAKCFSFFLIPYIPVRNPKKSFALTFKHLFSAINIILKQLHSVNHYEASPEKQVE